MGFQGVTLCYVGSGPGASCPRLLFGTAAVKERATVGDESFMTLCKPNPSRNYGSIVGIRRCKIYIISSIVGQMRTVHSTAAFEEMQGHSTESGRRELPTEGWQQKATAMGHRTPPAHKGH